MAHSSLAGGDGFSACFSGRGIGQLRRVQSDVPLHVCHGQNKPRNRRKKKVYEFNIQGPRPPPPTLDEYLAPPMEGTEEIYKKYSNLSDNELDSPLRHSKETALPWFLEVDFKNDEDAWQFIDTMEPYELQKQVSRYKIAFCRDDMRRKQALFSFHKQQERYRKEADAFMKKRILNANKKAERRAFRRSQKISEREKQKEMEASQETVDDRFLPVSDSAFYSTEMNGNSAWDAPIWLDEPMDDFFKSGVQEVDESDMIGGNPLDVFDNPEVTKS